MTWANPQQPQDGANPQRLQAGAQSRILEAGLKGGSLAALPGIISGSVAENVKNAPKIFHFGTNKALTVGVSMAGLGLGAMHQAHKEGIGLKQTAPLIAGSGGGDFVGGTVGMLAGEHVGQNLANHFHNPLLRVGSMIGGAVAGDTAGGVAGNIIGGKVAQRIQNNPTLTKAASLMSEMAPNDVIMDKSFVRMPVVMLGSTAARKIRD